jgi:hypothetical protein
LFFVLTFFWIILDLPASAGTTATKATATEAAEAASSTTTT